MNALTEFAKIRMLFLNEPATTSTIRERGELLGSQVELLGIYGMFDGEKMWGSWLPGFRINTISEVAEIMDETSDAWEWLEEDQGRMHPMRSFVPIISSSAKTNIGPLLDVRSSLHNHVLEYRYESGEVKVWSKSVRQFVEAFFAFSIQHVIPPPSLENAIRLYDFTERDLRFLSQWPDIVFPVINEPFLDVADL